MNKNQRKVRRELCTRKSEQILLSLKNGNVPPNKLDEMRASVIKQDCPLCGESNFKSIAGHFQQMHNIRSEELRDLLNFTYTETICSPDLHLKLSEIHKNTNPRKVRGPTYINRRQSKKGLENIANNLTPYSQIADKQTLSELGRRAGLLRKGSVPWNRTNDHGRLATYKRGCRCDLCKSCNKKHWREVNKRRKPTSVPQAK